MPWCSMVTLNAAPHPSSSTATLMSWGLDGALWMNGDKEVKSTSTVQTVTHLYNAPWKLAHEGIISVHYTEVKKL